jgi:hypothetical protein
MHTRAAQFGRNRWQRALAVLSCLTLLYFAAGGVFIHQHTGGPETVCPVCQALHMPALAAAPFTLLPEVRQVSAQAAPAAIALPFEPFASARASRAPPIA